MNKLNRLGAISTSLLLSIAAGGGLLAGGAMLVTGTTPCELVAACDTGAKVTTVSDTKTTTGACPITGAAATAEKDGCTDKAATPAATTVANTTEKAGGCCADKAAATKVANTAEKKAECTDGAKTVANAAQCTDAAKAVPASTIAAKTDDCCATKAATLVNAAKAQCTDSVKAVSASTTAAAGGCCAGKATTVASTGAACTSKTAARMIMAAGRYPVAVPANFTFGKVSKATCTDGAQATTVANGEYVCSGDPGCETDDSKVCSKGDDCHKATTAQADKAAVPAGAGS